MEPEGVQKSQSLVPYLSYTNLGVSSCLFNRFDMM